MQETLKKLLENPRFSDQDKKLTEKAFLISERAHHGQKRFSGEDYIVHPLATAQTLSEIGMDTTTIIAGLLHDTLEDTSLSAKEIKDNFGSDVLFLVEGVTKLGKIKYRGKTNIGQAADRQTMTLRKLFFAMAEDIRVVIIKLADRLTNMKTLEHVPLSKQKRIARETLEIYAPIAERLGMGHLKGELEDLAFPYAYPREYNWVIKHTRIHYANRRAYLEKIIPIIKKHLADNSITPIDIHSRIKHYYSLYRKLIALNRDAGKIYDLVALRIILPTTASCYEALGIIHQFYKPLPSRIKDYIAMPRPNGYQSLHTTVFCEGNIVEIQLRTPEMHHHAENGIAAHWIYTESGKIKDGSRWGLGKLLPGSQKTLMNTKEVDWVLRLRKSIEEHDDKQFMENIKIEFLKNRIFVFTPKGEPKELPEGSTPIDFAYAVHTDIGNATSGAMVHGKIVPLDYKLKQGDVVEIIKAKKPRPSQAWLRVVKTSEARKRIKHFLKVK